MVQNKSNLFSVIAFVLLFISFLSLTYFFNAAYVVSGPHTGVRGTIEKIEFVLFPVITIIAVLHLFSNVFSQKVINKASLVLLLRYFTILMALLILFLLIGTFYKEAAVTPVVIPD
jgi:hypothetical protein